MFLLFIEVMTWCCTGRDAVLEAFEAGFDPKRNTSYLLWRPMTSAISPATRWASPKAPPAAALMDFLDTN